VSDGVLSVLSIELEAKQGKLDRDLDRAEQKAKGAGEKMEGSLSLSKVAAGMVGVLAALGTIEAGFKSLTGVTQLFKGDIEGAFEAFEQIPLGIGPAIGAARDFFEVVSGSREEAERLAEEWKKVAGEINNAQAEVEALIEAQADAGKTDIDRSNERAQRFNELMRERRDLLLEIGAENAGDVDLSADMQQKLKDIGIEATTAADAIAQLREANEETFSAGMTARVDDMKAALERVADVEEQTRIDNLQSQGTTRDADLDIKRIKVEQDRDKQLADARSELEKKAIQEQFDLRMRLIDDEAAARRQAEKDAAFERERQAFQENRKRRELAEELAAKEAEEREAAREKEAEKAERNRFIEAKGIEAAEFLRTNFQGGDTGKPQEVKDPEAVAALEAGNTLLDQIARNTQNQAATLA